MKSLEIVRARLPRQAAHASWSAQPPIQHLLDGVAGFFKSEAHAWMAVHQLGATLGLQAGQVSLLAPADANWPRFFYRSMQWNRRPHGQIGFNFGPLGLVCLLGAGAGLLAALLFMEVDPLYGIELELLALSAASLCGAAVAVGLVALLRRRQPQFAGFDRTIRGKLRRGSWVVLVHDLQWSQQASVVTLIRQLSSKWCAVSSARRQT